ncbi:MULTISPECIES: molybdopterin-dependent oxidoreductase [Mycobacteriaceae]|uniref:molybdopterin-dependent oxidoreductase n=1 Tax=Mycobacteriaceae TaxID=1762 RepID=UPI0008017080|nr:MULTISPECIES: molybdopterin-dependent oxidoreductase [Mycobacteriaceae]MCK0174906.1 molybdopterin-dependent oxidoreductase [Mycolicibacterium sp. F2034L]OBB59263.1 oxidoreductase [Mycobacterium sp. 852013-51886_SCH5428379]
MGGPARSSRAWCGIAAAAVALGVTELVAAFFGPAADARTAVGSAVIDATPGPVKEWAISTFGMADKLVLSLLVLLVIAVIAAVAGALETRRVPIGSVAIVAGGFAGCAAVVSRAGATGSDVIPTIVGTVCGVVVLRLLVSGRFVDAADPVDGGPDRGRRLSLIALGTVALGAVAGAAGATLSRRAASVAGDRAAFVVPSPATPAPPIPPGVQPAGVALPSFITDNSDFYRIDTALNVPQVDRESWRLRIHGLVDREITYSLADLEQFEVVEKVVTLTCVSNPVGGNLISTATWTGYRVRDLLAQAGVAPDADMVLSTSQDGFTAGTPVEALTDGRDALLAVGMNGQPLPTEHGYPARLVVPGLYGYVSATKWVVDLELTRFDRAEAYWTRLGWSARGPIKTQSRIDVPRSGSDVTPGPVTFGGVAWAQDSGGVRKVEVRIDPPGGEGEWRQAVLGESYSDDTWRLWSIDWEAGAPGLYSITVRATDDTGTVQTPERADPVPDGATGWHRITFAVR